MLQKGTNHFEPQTYEPSHPLDQNVHSFFNKRKSKASRWICMESSRLVRYELDELGWMLMIYDGTCLYHVWFLSQTSVMNANSVATKVAIKIVDLYKTMEERCMLEKSQWTLPREFQHVLKKRLTSEWNCCEKAKMELNDQKYSKKQNNYFETGMKILEILHQHSLVHHFTSPVHAPSRRVISKCGPSSDNHQITMAKAHRADDQDLHPSCLRLVYTLPQIGVKMRVFGTFSADFCNWDAFGSFSTSQKMRRAQISREPL